MAKNEETDPRDGIKFWIRTGLKGVMDMSSSSVTHLAVTRDSKTNKYKVAVIWTDGTGEVMEMEQD